MSLKVYHQLGHNFKWNLESLKDDRCGDGVVLAPRFMKKEIVDKLPIDIKRNSIFDPQFFKPDTAKGKLGDYEFFPSISGRKFETDDFPESFSTVCAEKCLQFQNLNQFHRLVIPCRWQEGTPSNYIDQQESLFVQPFLEEIRRIKLKKPVLLQLIVNSLMLKEKEFISDILNWVSGLDIHGVYLIAEENSTSKQVKDSEFLLNLFDFIDAIKSNQMEVVLGYLNTESILLSLADPDIVTIGAYENMRSFDIRTFLELGKKKRSPPNARIYSSRLLQWVEWQYLGALRQAFTDLSIFFDENKYQAIMFEPDFEWHFTKPALYKHHFLVIFNQLSGLAQFNGRDRYIAVKGIIQGAMRLYKKIDEKNIILDSNSDGSHLPHWLNVANLFAKKKGWL